MASPDISVQRCIALLESIKYPPGNDQLTTYYENTINTCEKYLGKYDTNNCSDHTQQNVKLQIFQKYICLAIRSIVEQSPNLSEQFSVSQVNLLIHWIQIVVDRFLVPNLNAKLQENSVIAAQPQQKQQQQQQQPRSTPETELSDESRLNRLESILTFMSIVFANKDILHHDQMELTLLKVLAGLNSVYHDAVNVRPDRIAFCATMMDTIFDKQPEKYLRFLFILKYTPTLDTAFHEQIHKDLLRRIQSPGGFGNLCRVILPLSTNRTDEDTIRKTKVIVDIIARAGHVKQFYPNIIEQIEDFIKVCQNSKQDSSYLVVCISCLNKLHKILDLKTEQVQIERIYLANLNRLTQPEDILTGIVLFDQKELVNYFHLLRVAFTGPAIVTMVSKLLIKYLPLLLQLHNKLAMCNQIQADIVALVNRCLNNRENTELCEIVESLLLEEYPLNWLQLHPRVMFKSNESSSITTCQIGDSDQYVFYSASEVLVTILKSSNNNNILMHNIFLHLLEQLVECLDSPDCSDLINNMDEISLLVSNRFKRRIAVIGTLSELINHKPLHAQFNENPSSIIQCLTNIIRKQVDSIRDDSTSRKDLQEPVMVIVLSIIRELLDKIQYRDDFQKFLVALKEYRQLSSDPTIFNHIDGILVLLNESPRASEPIVESVFDIARSLCAESEPHLKAYGLVRLTKLVQAAQDPEVLAKRHSILAIAMDALRNDDSYVFLNCIRLLVALVELLEAEVLETMITEFRLPDGDVDMRLKVGEVIVKVTEQLGPFAIRYKPLLINCFLLGATNSNNEIRTSSLSNMGTICRFLRYQVHDFFEELMQITHSTITTDKYVPARRAATMMVAYLIQGFDKLQDFEEILLPVYRALKYVQSNETDEQTVVHAEIGLGVLTEKVKTFLTTGPPAEREIQVIGVKSTNSTTRESGDDRRKGKSILHIV